MSIKTTISLSFLSMMLGANAVAQTVSLDDARSRAQAFFTQSRHARPIGEEASQLQLAYTARSGAETYYYVFNLPASNTFIVVGGDALAPEVLGYCQGRLFEADSMPDNLRWWLSLYEEQIHQAKTLGLAPRHAALLPEGLDDIGPLLQTQWDQDDPYWNAIPKVKGSHPYTGCVATATAQVMKYYEWPAQGTGSHSYDWEVSGKNTTFSANFGATTYDWANMTNTYSAASTDAQKNAVATLMYHVGVSLDMQYGLSGSGASTGDVPKALSTYFSYNPCATTALRDWYTDAEWLTLVHQELAEGRPVIYGGVQKGETVGHCFVIDGYQAETQMFSINWGWSGEYNTYFTLMGVEGLRPNGTGSGGGAAGSSYSSQQQAIVYLTPDVNLHADPILYSYSDNLLYYVDYDAMSYVPGSEHTIGDDYYFDYAPALLFFPYNPGPRELTVEFGIKYVDVLSNAVYYSADIEQATLASNPTSIQGYGIYIDESALPGQGTFELSPVFRLSAQDTWKDLRIANGQSLPLLHVTRTMPVHLAMTEAEWRTLALPFASEVPAGLTAYEVTGFEDQHLLLEPVTQLDADQGYLLHGPAALYTFIPNSSSTSQSTPHSSFLIPNSTFASIEANAGSYVLQNLDGQVGFYRVEGSIQVPPYSAYLSLPANVNPVSHFYLSDQTTAIETLPDSSFPIPQSTLLLPHFYLYEGRVIYVK